MMYQKVMQLSPTQMQFSLYGNETILEHAPPFWSTHRYYIKNSYHYEMDISLHQAKLSLENICKRRKVKFEEIDIDFFDYVTMLQDTVEAGKNYICFDVKLSYQDFDQNFCDKKCVRKSSACDQLMHNHPTLQKLTIYFDKDKLKEIFSNSENVCIVEPAMQNSVQNIIYPKEEVTMNEMNNGTNVGQMQANQPMQNGLDFLGGIDFEFSMVTDPDIASTLFGVVFKGENNHWYRFDKEKGVRTDLTGVIGGDSMPKLPMYILPETRDNIKKGDLIKFEGEFFYVKKKKENAFILVSARTGKEEKVYPASNIFNMEFFKKVFVLMDGSLIDINHKDVSGNLIFAMMLMGGNMNADMQSFLPLLMCLKNSDNPFSSLFSGLGEGTDMAKMLPLMMLGMGNSQTQNGNTNTNPMTQMMMMSVLSGFMKPVSKSEEKKKKKKKKKKATIEEVSTDTKPAEGVSEETAED